MWGDQGQRKEHEAMEEEGREPTNLDHMPCS